MARTRPLGSPLPATMTLLSANLQQWGVHRPDALTDGFGRVHRALRLSVTDRCNLRCRYCMPAEGMDWLPKDELLSFEELERLTRLLAGMGVTEIRVTGASRSSRDVRALIGRISAIDGINEVVDHDQRRAAGRADRRPRRRRSGTRQRQRRLARPRSLRGSSPAAATSTVCSPGLRPASATRSSADQGQRRPAAWAVRAGRRAARRARPPPALRRAVHRGHAARRPARLGARRRCSRAPRCAR